MDPELANRLRRYGDELDRAAIAAQTGRPAVTPATDIDDTDALPTVVAITTAHANRRFQMVAAAAAAAIVVAAGALVTWQVTGKADPSPADSTQVTVDTTARPSTTSTPTSVPVTTLALIPSGDSSPSSSTTSSTTSPLLTSSAGHQPATTVACPDYDAYGTRFPIRLCHTGPAVELIQERVGAPEIDGLFGPATRQSVRVFQHVHDLEVDGLVGPDTWAAMFPDGAPGTDSDGDGTVEPWEIA